MWASGQASKGGPGRAADDDSAWSCAPRARNTRAVPARSELPVLLLDSQAAWSQWLEQNHGDSDGVWLKFAKKASGVTTVNHSEALEEALCYGWIDGQGASHDESFYLVRFTPRRPRSKWSQHNRNKVLRLIEQKRMKSA